MPPICFSLPFPSSFHRDSAIDFRKLVLGTPRLYESFVRSRKKLNIQKEIHWVVSYSTMGIMSLVIYIEAPDIEKVVDAMRNGTEEYETKFRAHHLMDCITDFSQPDFGFESLSVYEYTSDVKWKDDYIFLATAFISDAVNLLAFLGEFASNKSANAIRMANSEIHSESIHFQTFCSKASSTGKLDSISSTNNGTQLQQKCQFTIGEMGLILIRIGCNDKEKMIEHHRFSEGKFETWLRERFVNVLGIDIVGEYEHYDVNEILHYTSDDWK